jgi:glycosyltransferase involved in cell wall biosynthesis
MLVNHKSRENRNEGFVVAINDNDLIYEYPKEVKLTIRQERQEDYYKAAKFINLSGADLCILEHGFGIIGGNNGVYILPLLHRLEVPLIVALHTILKTPSYDEKAVLHEICKMADKIVVMTNKAFEFLVSIYNVPEEKIAFIEHGVPDIHYSQEKSKKEFKFESKKVLLTFGFIGRNKGIETVIKALPGVVEKHHNILYTVLGKTHPSVLRQSGEEYRITLLRLVKNLQLEKHDLFLNKFIDTEDLFKYLSAADVYITPYLNEAQITSGTLSYAVGVDSAVISTPYWHAVELLAEGRGRLFNFNDSTSLTSTLTELLDKPDELKKLKRKEYDYGRKITWPKTGEKYIALAEKILKAGQKVNVKKDTGLDLLILPPFLSIISNV